MGWCFAIVNGRLAEVFFEKKRKHISILGHAYVARNKYKTKKEVRWIEKDTSKFRFVYRKGAYKDLTRGDVYTNTKQAFSKTI